VIDDLDRLIWDEQENDGMGFKNWTVYPNHPDLGEVEIGGWDPKFYSQNPPAKFMEKWVKNQALFNLEMVKHLPELAWDKIEVKKLRTYKKDSADYEVKVIYRNVGKLPTALRQADQVKIVRPDQVTLTLPESITGGNNPIARIIPEANTVVRDRPGVRRLTNSTTRNAGYAQGGAANSVSIVVRVYGEHVIEGKASVSTTRAGLLPEKSFTIR